MKNVNMENLQAKLDEATQGRVITLKRGWLSNDIEAIIMDDGNTLLLNGRKDLCVSEDILVSRIISNVIIPFKMVGVSFYDG